MTSKKFVEQALDRIEQLPPNFGYVEIFNNAVHLDIDISDEFNELIVNYGFNYSGGLDKKLKKITLSKNDIYAFTVIAHELMHSINNLTSPLGCVIAHETELFLFLGLKLMSKYPRVVGNVQLLSDIAVNCCLEDKTDIYLFFQKLYHLKLLYLNSKIDIIEPSYMPIEVQIDNQGYSYLLLKDVMNDKSEIKKILIDFRLITENLSASVEQVLIQLFDNLNEERDPITGLPESEYIKQLHPNYRYYWILSLYITQKISPIKKNKGTLNLLIKEMLLFYSVILSDKMHTIIPFGTVLNILINIINNDECPEVKPLEDNNWKKFANFIFKEIKKALPFTENSFSELINKWCDNEKKYKNHKFSPLWYRRKRGSELYEIRAKFNFFSPRLAYDKRLALYLLKTIQIPVYSQKLCIITSDVLDVKYGLDSSEFDFNIVTALLFGKQQRCTHNHFGKCKGILYGIECDDSDGSPSEHPCGFFDHRREINNIVYRKNHIFVPPTDNLNKLKTLFKSLKPIWRKGNEYY